MGRRAPQPATSLTHALLYTRISGSEHQKEGLSLDTQERTTRTYAAAQPGWVIAGEYQDVQKGSDDSRPQYQAVLSHARQLHAAGARAAVVVVRLDRLGRHLLESVRAREELSKLGADTHAIKEGGLLSDLTAHILMSVAQEEARKLGERVAEVRSHIVNNGWAYGRTAFGYQQRPATPDERTAGSPKNVIEPDPLTQGVATEAFQRMADGATIRSVARWLSDLPETSRGKRTWAHPGVVRMLRSPTYIARSAEGVGDGVSIADVLSRPPTRWLPLVPDATWVAVQERLDGHERRPHQATNRFLLTGFIKCDRCGSRAVGASKRGRRGYRCGSAWAGVNAPIKGCERMVALKASDDAVLAQVVGVLDALATPSQWPALRAAWQSRQQPTSDLGRRIADLERAISRSRRRLADAATLLVDGALDRAGYEALRDAETAALTTAEIERERLSAVRPTPSLPPLDRVLELAGGWAVSLRESDVRHQRDVLDALVERVTVSRVAGSLRYEADVTWTPLGEHLRALAAAH
jgi:site-specific DNA recombinase